MPRQYNYRVTGSITLTSTGTASITVCVGLRIVENDVLGRIFRGTLEPVEVTLNPGDSKKIDISGPLTLRALLRHSATFVIATDSALRNVLISVPVDFTPVNPFAERVDIASIRQDQKNIYVTVRNLSATSRSFVLGATLAKRIAGSGCDLYIPEGDYRDLPLQTVNIGAGGTFTARITLTDQDLANFDYIIVKVWDDDPTKYDRRVAYKLCLDGDALRLEKIRYGAEIRQAYVSGGKLYVSVANTGTAAKTFYVGASVIESGKYAGQKCELWVTGGRVWDLPPKSITLQAGQSGSTSFDLSALPEGRYQVIVKVWDGYDPSRNVMVPPCYDGTVTSTFEVRAQVTYTSPTVTATPY